MVTPFNIWDFSLVYNEKQKLVWLFFLWIKTKIPKLFKNNNDLFLYCLKSCGLTEENPDDYIWKVFNWYIDIRNTWIKIDKILDFIPEEQDKYDTIEFLFNKIKLSWY